ncbi:fusaric acid resistance protein [Mycolicibacterium chitae]|uniref:Membrane protein-like protein n=3 Tax=Mycobacteriaceae TaxID=1762 RepID=A0A3S4RMQ3_MYCCI|nr:fusaric acid resistance protein [Mycolicibacterium chitae]VEG48002.1 Membrane protein-like protein [Mycolicibacterium chitae]
MAAMFRGLAVPHSWPYVGEVARSLLPVLLIGAIALQWASPAAAVAAAGSAAVVGATALQDSAIRRLLPMLCAVVLGLGVATFLGHLTSPHTWLYVPVVGVWTLGTGLFWALSSPAGLAAAAGAALMVTAPPTPAGWSAALGSALAAAALAVLGGGLQVLLVAVWPRQRWVAQRSALADAYGWVATTARKLALNPAASWDPTPLMDLREAVHATDRHTRRRPPAFRGSHALPERIAMTLNALRADADEPEVREVLLASADALAAIGAGGPAAPVDATIALRRAEDCAAALSGSAATAAQRLHTQIAKAGALQLPGWPAARGTEQDPQGGLRGHLRAARATIAAQCNGDSPILRHALRVTAAVVAGLLIARLTETPQGYWVALTALLVLRPETAHTYTRCVSRIAGVTIGVVAASLVTVLWQPTGMVAVTVAVALLALAYAVASYGPVPLYAALAGGIILLIDMAGTTDSAAMGQRVVATVVGGGLAVTCHVLLPDRTLVRLRQRAGELLRAESDYAATVVRAFAHPLDQPEVTLSAVWQRTTRARSAFEAAGSGVRADMAEVRHWLTAYRAALNAITGACAALEAQLPAVHHSTLDPRFVVAVDDYVDALQGELPSAGQMWTIDARHLAEADAQLRQAAARLGKQDTAQRVLVAETETITRHLLTVAELS